MAADQRRAGVGGEEGPFGVLDGKLNIYALANGMDLIKEPGRRRLGWYREGMERAIDVEPSGDGTMSVTALCWKTNDPSTERRAPQRERVPPEDLAAELSAILEAALEAANAL